MYLYNWELIFGNSYIVWEYNWILQIPNAAKCPCHDFSKLKIALSYL